LNFSWTKDGKTITETASGYSLLNSNILSLHPAMQADAGTYSYSVTNKFGTVTSNSFKVTINANPNGPTISAQPLSIVAPSGGSVTFSVSATAPSGTLTFQWYKDSNAISGANSSSLVISAASSADEGNYIVWVSNNYSTVASGIATLTVGTSDTNPTNGNLPQTRVINLSTRANVGTGANILIAGFIINGSTPKKMLIRALGPTLSNYSVKNPLADPTLKIVDSAGNILTTNDDWQTTSNLDDFNAASTKSNAVPLPNGSKDAALVTTLSPGGYTALVSGQSGTTGVALVELYEVDTDTVNQLVNISSRANVGTGDAVTIAGIIVSGSVPKKFLVRAIGPGLQARSVPGFLADPQFQVVDSSSNIVAANDNWETSDTLADTKSVTTQVNAVPLDSGSKDAALTVTLAPGGYTVVVRGTGGTSGVALVELYQAP
jgi:hypothetical protein